ncbi:hypothetical protein [Pseudomonas syringae]|uniref:hypothetical protein n=1 Tax=Pseudomonas syringae TaxID=317 RepID=UPI000A1F1D48|nr:hypothetical protein [Pseudomonas syringae]OSO49006.1 hypothetical protein BV364_00016 [Pseudomonas syringae pv. actinidiae]
MINNQIHRNKILDNLKGIDSDKASIRAAKRKEIEESFIIQNFIVCLAFFIIIYSCGVYVIEYVKEIQYLNSNLETFFYFFIAWFSTISVFSLLLSAKAIRGLILHLVEYVSLLKAIIHTAVISALATTLSFFVNSELAANYLKSVEPQTINNYYMLPTITYFLFFTFVGMYYLFRNLGYFGKPCMVSEIHKFRLF